MVFEGLFFEEKFKSFVPFCLVLLNIIIVIVILLIRGSYYIKQEILTDKKIVDYLEKIENWYIVQVILRILEILFPLKRVLILFLILDLILIGVLLYAYSLTGTIENIYEEIKKIKLEFEFLF